MLGEFLTAFRHTPRLRRIAARRVHQITADRQIRVLPQSDYFFQAGFALYQARPDKAYSLTDCISMELMRQQGIADILTHDNHFTQEGFIVLQCAATCCTIAPSGQFTTTYTQPIQG
jgi:uncharacterized protein